MMDAKNVAGLFITLEGIDGCGKSLMSQLLYNWFQKQGHSNVCLTYEPGGSPFAKRIRNLLLNSAQNEITAEAEVLLFAADRAQHVADVIEPALLDGQIVICDRYIDSFMAYQGGGRGIPFDVLQFLNKFSTQGHLPNITFYLQLSLEQAQERRGQEIDRIELEEKEFYERIKIIYDKLAEANPQRIITIDASLEPEQVFAEIQTAMEEYLNKHAGK